jgi:glycosyltransferase involved in cell wall biosynthesis
VPNIEVVGSSPRTSLGAQYTWADVLILPSLAEGFPLVAIEAMACGTPCIVSSSTFAEDVIDDWVNGVIVPPADSGAIETAIRRLAGDPALRQAMSNAASRTASKFTWSRYKSEAAQMVLSLALSHQSHCERA